MVVISQLPGDGSNGGDPNKNPKELQKNPQEDEENQIENPQEDDNDDPQEDDNDDPQEDNDDDPQEDDDDDPQEDDENQNQNPQEVVNVPLALPYPPEIMENIFRGVQSCDYPAILVSSRALRHFIASQELYNERLNHGLTESILYVLIGFKAPDRDEFPRWYILYRNIPRKITVKLRQLSAMRSMFPGCAVVTIGQYMYVIGGCRSGGRATKNVFRIDCRVHRCEPLPDMHRARCRAAAGVIDGNIYVIGGCKMQYNDWVEEFNVQTRIWTTRSCFPPLNSGSRGEFVTSVVMQEKIYILDRRCCLAYEPTRRGRQWENQNVLWDYWRGSCCVIDHLLYTIDPYHFLGHLIVVYEPNDRLWRPVMGEYRLPGNFVYNESRLVNFNGNLMIVGPTRSYQIWCIEIALEYREGNEIWGEIVSRALVLSSDKKPDIELCCSVRV